MDVARDAMQMYGLGADVNSIRAAIEKKWAPYASGKTNTPMPPPRPTKPAAPTTSTSTESGPFRADGPSAPIIIAVDERAAAFARLVEAVHEGVYIGSVGPAATSTLLANPYLRLVLGLPPETPDTEVRPFDPDRFADPHARVAFLDRLATAGHGHRLPGSPDASRRPHRVDRGHGACRAARRPRSDARRGAGA